MSRYNNCSFKLWVARHFPRASVSACPRFMLKTSANNICFSSDIAGSSELKETLSRWYLKGSCRVLPKGWKSLERWQTASRPCQLSAPILGNAWENHWASGLALTSSPSNAVGTGNVQSSSQTAAIISFCRELVSDSKYQGRPRQTGFPETLGIFRAF